MTWVIENGEIKSEGATGTLLVIEQFTDLQRHF
jgi:hypothetical protein